MNNWKCKVCHELNSILAGECYNCGRLYIDNAVDQVERRIKFDDPHLLVEYDGEYKIIASTFCKTAIVLFDISPDSGIHRGVAFDLPPDPEQAVEAMQEIIQHMQRLYVMVDVSTFDTNILMFENVDRRIKDNKYFNHFGTYIAVEDE